MSEDIQQLLQQLIPVGSIIAFNEEEAPPGWAQCDGGEYDRSDGKGTIKTPDLNGRVIVGKSPDLDFGSQFGDFFNQLSFNFEVVDNFAGGGTQSGLRTTIKDDRPLIDDIKTAQPSLVLSYIMKV